MVVFGLLLTGLVISVLVLAAAAPRIQRKRRSSQAVARGSAPLGERYGTFDELESARPDWKRELYNSIPDYSKDKPTVTGVLMREQQHIDDAIAQAGKAVEDGNLSVLEAAAFVAALAEDGRPVGEVEVFAPRVEPVSERGYEFGQFDHPTTIDYDSNPSPTTNDSPSPSDDSGPSTDFGGGESSGGGSSGGFDE